MKSQILSKLTPGHPWGELLQYYPRVDSTNTLAKQLAADGAPHGTVLVAGCQTGGRGRMGRSFHSPANTGLYFSLILRPSCAPSQLMHLTCAAGVALSQAVEDLTGCQAGLKWINDLVCGGRKVAGILTEMSLNANAMVDYAVVGIGVNCRQQLSDFPVELRDAAGSLRTQTGVEVLPAHLAAALMNRLLETDRLLLTGKADLIAKYRARCITLGKEVSVLRADSLRHGTALGLDDDGGLIVRFTDGSTETVNSGEASVRGLYGYL